MMRLKLELFGPVRAWRGGQEMALGSAQRRALLAILALKANQVITRSELIDAVWGEKAPASASGSIYTYVSSLRSALDPERTHGGAAEVLTSSGPGYCLRVDAESIDVVRFERLRERARLCQRANDFPGALAALESALSLGEDEPLAGLPGPYAAAQRERLRELRLELVERRAKIMLDMGEHQQVLAELRPFAAEHRMRDGLQSLHLLALYRCGYRDEGVQLFERLRADTVDELGIEPGSELTLRYEQIKADDPALWRGLANASRTSAAVQPPSAADDAGSFVGRSCELRSLRSALSGLATGRGTSVLLEGEPGIGKSALISAGLATATGCTVAVAGADELTRHVPLQVLLDRLDVTTNSADPRRSAVAREIRRLSLDEPPGIAAAVDLVVGLVGTLCRERPLVLVLDDLQWADDAGLELWRRLAADCAGSPLVLIGVCRPVPGRHRLNDLRRELAAGGTLVHVLKPLPDAEVRDLVAALTGAEPGPALLELTRTAAGNPLLVREIIRALAGNEAPEPAAPGARPAIPPAVLEVIGRWLGILSAAAAEVLRWAALLDRYFTRGELAAALGRPADELDDVLSEVVALGLVVRARGKLTMRHPAVREALYARTPAAIRLALHRQLAEALAEADAPVESVAFHLLAAPLPVDRWQCEWLTREIYPLAARSPLSAMRLLRRVNTATTVPAALREGFAIATARTTLWLERDLAAGAGMLATRTKDAAVVAEMRWLLAYARLVCGDVDLAAKGIKEALRDPAIPANWRGMHEALLSRTRVGWWPVCTSAPDQPVAPIPAQRTTPGLSTVDAFWLGRWEACLTELTQRLHGGPTLVKHTLGRPTALRRLSGVAAVIAAHRGRADDARAHLMSVWSLAPAGEFGADGTDFILAANALLAELQGQPELALSLLSSMLEVEDPVVCPWMPDLVRLAIDLGEHDRAKLATLLCERTPDQETAALRCRALLDADPVAALTAAARARESGNRFGEAQAMEDAAKLFADDGKPVKAEAALHAALNAYAELGAVLDAERAERRIRPEHHRTRR
ncbi:BTAD domain-containing putative transcriptional regulator [Amycolatopsis mongoliensis]|uniref:BTAD domain-containing putative transcriptional regulator n=1 Tax=Amycolatopsis mongoliensis TaxID=715475 RepID=A0A9Y2JHI4_9PSEU|nr:BTAD domain-containing putative transcriptional regulator [Amycolatopsis sp. 4-36]WIX98177.1 BTAD domain-containing putative transcriptional regulator [Amycolatopsis sp. 4-36]